MQTCKTCKWWTPPGEDDRRFLCGSELGTCLVSEYGTDNWADDDSGVVYSPCNTTVPVPLMIANDGSGYLAVLRTAADFGCIHHTPKEDSDDKN